MIKNHKKVADKQGLENEETKTPGVLVGPAFDFLFEGENNEYEREYEDYI
ncbi:hypothetical protein [Aneurinibacillus aneurinilyticus]|jgi:hypothetical protein|uniref:Uncharacterized protein n=1 Tax=Aneurinibacillus aneurinilyticus ATCC 12856 TaxID=649747 RepID=U1Y580_ANEAE|nr:hypothetical protein [Aneurinibacillus aneurinilyticus]ERI07292.1 hypothetical protein HMPREF0083_04625 [Aneurinibacillus aneurinilyticus ATCC 12856]MED0709483.1 hypothetical protein [Aneurinibacillus aneurinilyticus]MED0725871.1 hypothetical protein [Aneurinibacillus aneurinilyticus]MED0730409.1 hypothetical protein [Aneurinibacillus aneurinilyticus]MED0739141.1 hypothetical protein [Aneurinibacillus aneurinilyticus]